MKLKTYQARSMSEALAQVRSGLGPDAVILHTRNVKRGGVFGIGAKSLVEITATADQRINAARAAARQAELQLAAPVATTSAAISATQAYRQSSSEPDVTRPVSLAQTSDATEDVIEIKSAGYVQTDEKSPSALEIPTPSDRDGEMEVSIDADIQREIEEIHRMVKGLMLKNGGWSVPAVPEDLLNYYTQLIGQDVADELAVTILERVHQRIKTPQSNNQSEADRQMMDIAPVEQRIHHELISCIREMLPTAAPLELIAEGRPTIAAMIGPTGVGKTTTIAKLAANMKLRENKRVGLVTVDTYRIAAVEQLKTYADILNVPLKAVSSPRQMQTAIEQMSDLDLILIDTAGRSQRDELRIAELDEYLKAARPDQVHLVLSSTAKEQALREAIEKFSPLGADRLIFTKLDEAVGLGVLLNVLQNVEMKIAYLTNGQSVPDDIERGCAHRVAELILGRRQEELSVLQSPVTRVGEDLEVML